MADITYICHNRLLKDKKKQMKKSFDILMIVCAIILVASCNNGPRSLSEMLKDEKKAINRLIDREDITILSAYPEDGVFKENEFFQLSNGVYINVVDSGNGERAELGSTIISSRFEGEYIYVLSDTTETISGFENNVYPVRFVYGQLVPVASSFYSYLLCEGLQVGLSHVGDRSQVKLIIPFKVGSYTQQQGGNPLYLTKVTYTFENPRTRTHDLN